MIVGHGPDLRNTYGLPATKDKVIHPYIKPGVKYSPRMQEALCNAAQRHKQCRFRL